MVLHKFPIIGEQVEPGHLHGILGYHTHSINLLFLISALGAYISERVQEHNIARFKVTFY